MWVTLRKPQTKREYRGWQKEVSEEETNWWFKMGVKNQVKTGGRAGRSGTGGCLDTGEWCKM